MNERMRFNPAEASAAGLQDAQALLLALANIEQGAGPAELLGNALAGIIGLAADQLEALRATAIACTVQPFPRGVGV